MNIGNYKIRVLHNILWYMYGVMHHIIKCIKVVYVYLA